MTGTGSLSGEAGATSVGIDTLSGTAFGFPVELAGPTAVTIANGEVRLSGVNLAAGGGQVSVEGAVSPDLDLRVAIDAVAASFVNEFVPGLDADGTISGNATVTGTPDAPEFAWTATWTDFAIDATASIGLPPLAVTARGQGDLKATSVDAEATGGGLTLTATGSVPLTGDGVELSLDGRSSGLDLGQPVLARLLSGETTLSATVTTGPEGRIAIADLAIGGTGLTATGDLTLQGETIDGTHRRPYRRPFAARRRVRRRGGIQCEDLRLALNPQHQCHRRCCRRQDPRPAGHRRVGKRRGRADRERRLERGPDARRELRRPSAYGDGAR